MSKPMGTVKHYCSNEHCKKGMKEHLSNICNRCRRGYSYDG